MQKGLSWFFTCGVLMVLAQSAATIGILTGTVAQACGSTDQCRQAGQYCQVGGMDRCQFCGSMVPMPLQIEPMTGAILNAPFTKQGGVYGGGQFGGFNASLAAEICAHPAARMGNNGAGDDWPFTRAGVASWCETCVHRVDGTVDPIDQRNFIAANVAAMGLFDWVALTFATFVVAFAVVGELKDIKLCGLAIHHAGDKISGGWSFWCIGY